ncbi:LysR substrate-binding domain-containing protein [Rhizobium leguminosarum]|uniref:LysR substrate-binding domain-containing protein n=1 Tax=Rhizobium leguminosarum TaxID=384 RepID=UPI003D7C28CD
MPRVFRSFCGEFPNVNISLVTRNSGTVQGWIATQEFDIGLTGNAIDHPGLLTLPFTAAAGVCVMPAAHPLAARLRRTERSRRAAAVKQPTRAESRA